MNSVHNHSFSQRMNKYRLLFTCKAFRKKVHMGSMACYATIAALLYAGCVYGAVKLTMHAYYKGVFSTLADGIMPLLSYLMLLLTFGVPALLGYIASCKVSLMLFGAELDYHRDRMQKMYGYQY